MTPTLAIFLDLIPQDLRKILEENDDIKMHELDKKIHIVCASLTLAASIKHIVDGINLHAIARRVEAAIVVDCEETLQETYDLLELLKGHEIKSIKLTIVCASSVDAHDLWNDQEKLFRAITPTGRHPEFTEPSLQIDIGNQVYGSTEGRLQDW